MFIYTYTLGGLIYFSLFCGYQKPAKRKASYIHHKNVELKRMALVAQKPNQNTITEAAERVGAERTPADWRLCSPQYNPISHSAN